MIVLLKTIGINRPRGSTIFKLLIYITTGLQRIKSSNCINTTDEKATMYIDWKSFQTLVSVLQFPILVEIISDENIKTNYGL